MKLIKRHRCASTESRRQWQRGKKGMAASSARSHEDRILWQLQAAFPSWVPALTLSRISLQYNARVFGLRRKGWQIESGVQVVNGVRHGSFRLAQPGTFPNPRPQPSHSPKAKNKITEASQPVAL